MARKTKRVNWKKEAQKYARYWRAMRRRYKDVSDELQFMKYEAMVPEMQKALETVKAMPESEPRSNSLRMH